MQASEANAQSLPNPFHWPNNDPGRMEAGLIEPVNFKSKEACLLETPVGLAWRRLHYGTAKLEGVHGSAHLLAFFAMEAMAELQVSVPSGAPGWLFSLYAVNTVLLIALNIFALMVSTCLLPRMSAISEEYDIKNLRVVPNFSPHDRLHNLVSLSAGLAHVFGLFLFLLEIILLNWVKFWDFSLPAAFAGSVTMVPFLVLFTLAVFHFRRTLAKHRAQNTCSTRLLVKFENSV
ncbi:calcium release-activated calcium channel protein 1-like [Neocloeon triangulifer]|uniref:calcium release-activated calcium channel protein 1-like n=1 Tax=Neocloeon triangulifer TaxID=2078957 RepID=UPI00286FAE52|nr:calcium release-activated calcium channel protein 1-like [Neocloeon triangulifer]